MGHFFVCRFTHVNLPSLNHIQVEAMSVEENAAVLSTASLDAMLYATNTGKLTSKIIFLPTRVL